MDLHSLRTYVLPQNMTTFYYAPSPTATDIIVSGVACGALPVVCQVELVTNDSLVERKPRLPQDLS